VHDRFKKQKKACFVSVPLHTLYNYKKDAQVAHSKKKEVAQMSHIKKENIKIKEEN